MYSIFQFISKLFWFIIFLLLSMLIAIFVGSNTQIIYLSFWPIPGQITIVIWLAILIAFGLGLICGALIIWFNSILSYRTVRQRIKRNIVNSGKKKNQETEHYLMFDHLDNRSHSEREKVKQNLSRSTQSP